MTLDTNEPQGLLGPKRKETPVEDIHANHAAAQEVLLRYQADNNSVSEAELNAALLIIQGKGSPPSDKPA
jgi:hypothetical protein